MWDVISGILTNLIVGVLGSTINTAIYGEPEAASTSFTFPAAESATPEVPATAGVEGAGTSVSPTLNFMGGYTGSALPTGTPPQVAGTGFTTLGTPPAQPNIRPRTGFSAVV